MDNCVIERFLFSLIARNKNVLKESKDVLMDMESYMNQMDQELAKTDVGQSFERLPPTAKVEEVNFSCRILVITINF